MSDTLEKVRRLEHYIAGRDAAIDPVLDLTVDKLLQREQARVTELKERLADQLAEFEKRFQMESPDFYARYERGEMGDDLDFVEWAATVEMLANVEQQFSLLHSDVAP